MGVIIFWKFFGSVFEYQIAQIGESSQIISLIFIPNQYKQKQIILKKTIKSCLINIILGIITSPKQLTPSKNHPQKMIPQKQIINNMQQFYREVKNKWNSIYPNYFNANKTIAEGRRVAKELAVVDPTVEEISMAVGLCRIKNIIQPHKAYSRDFLERGRLKVEIFDKDGKPMNPDLTSKKIFMAAVARKLKDIRANQQPHKK